MAKIKLRPFKSKEEHEALIALADGENHLVIHPSQVIAKDDKPIGYLSIFSAPIVLAYFSEKECDPRSTVQAIEAAEAHMRALGHKHYFVLCDNYSPFFQVMEKLGFKQVFQTNFMEKAL